MARHQSRRSADDLIAAHSILDDAIQEETKKAPDGANVSREVMPRVLDRLHVAVDTDGLWDMTSTGADGYCEAFHQKLKDAEEIDIHDLLEYLHSIISVAMFKGVVTGMLAAQPRDSLARMAMESPDVKRAVAQSKAAKRRLTTRRPR